jgi:hypothetical protein
LRNSQYHFNTQYHSNTYTIATKHSLFQIPKLKGSENFKLWALQFKAILRNQDLQDTLENKALIHSAKALNILYLTLNDGPLLQLQDVSNAKAA